ncbi:MAG TPA: GNAT family N-acetyltransferase [Acinetobacter johnsonii]|nr:GNAT family N-acetyltransferase [Acinetobacter johnsonii]
MEVPNIHIVPLTEIDQSIWTTLWQAYQADLLERISENTWHKLTDSKREHIYGFAALMAGQVVGIVHVVEHNSCWTLKPYAYLQDLFTHEDYCGLGGARALIEHVKMYTEKRACDRVYWLTHQDNLIAQQIYNKVAKKTGFIQYRA